MALNLQVPAGHEVVFERLVRSSFSFEYNIPMVVDLPVTLQSRGKHPSAHFSYRAFMVRTEDGLQQTS